MIAAHNKKILILLVTISAIFIGSNSSANDNSDFDEFEDFNFDLKASKKISDPFEKFNRVIFSFNDVADRGVLEPAAKSYQKFIPNFVRRSFRNFFNNIFSPFTIINSILQGNAKNAMSTTSSFIINSSLGFGGIFDIASSKNIKYLSEDFGQTLGFYGVESGPYIVLPFLGPSNLRDSSAMFVENLVDPLAINIFNVGNDNFISDKLNYSLKMLEIIDKRESLLKIVSELRNNSFDQYSAARSAYNQNRHAKIKNFN